MLSKRNIELIFDAASIQRWNDHIRPGKGFTELDKQSHKMMFAYVLARTEEEDRKANIDWRLLIEGGIFEFLHRIVLTDIKPPIFHLLMEKKGDMLNDWVLAELQGYGFDLVENGFFEKFSMYLKDPGYARMEKRILKASHYLATNWEFDIIYNLNKPLYGLEETRRQISNEIEEHYDLAGVQKLILGKKTRSFLSLVGQLRFQQRWAQSPRVPETSVLGHMLVVAILSYFCTLQLRGCNKRIINNFFAALFHDLPEVLTRDIVSPVKRSVEGLEELIKEIESTQLEERIFPLLPSAWRKEIKYLVENEFNSRIMEKGATRIVTSDEINRMYNKDEYSPVDGEIIRGCDHLSACIEASLSISHGITSRYLEEGLKSLHDRYAGKNIAGIDFSELFGYFKL
ncbi:MAG: HD domain-containing protein [Clostridiaceae bacterium]|nr:HD domain-containing protein [Clostridiaceae bacterium]